MRVTLQEVEHLVSGRGSQTIHPLTGHSFDGTVRVTDGCER